VVLHGGSFLGLATCFYNEVLPIWSVNRVADGGVHFHASDIGVLNVAAGSIVVSCPA
jgi:hypothetical protein